MNEKINQFYKTEATKLIGLMLDNLERIKLALEDVNVDSIEENEYSSFYFFQAVKKLSSGLEGFVEVAEIARITAPLEKE